MSDQRIVLPGPLLLVGCGKMGGALLRGWLSRGVPGKHVFVVDPAPRDLEDVQARGVTLATALDQLPAGLQPGIVLLAIKPQFMDEALPAYRRFVTAGHHLPVDRRRQDRRLPQGQARRRCRRRALDAQHPGRGRPRHDRHPQGSRHPGRRARAVRPAAVRRRPGRLDRRGGPDQRRHRRLRRRAGLCVPADRVPGGSRARRRPARRPRDAAGARDRRPAPASWRTSRPSPPPSCAKR